MAQVSVIIPVYNIEQHLRQCLDSVAAQTLQDIEIICVDDGSTDKSPAILKGYVEQDSRFQIITQRNAGPGAARNAGMAQADGEYIIFLDSDDWFEPNLLELLVVRANEAQSDITICHAVEFDTRSGQTLPSGWMLKDQYLPGETFAPQSIAPHIFQFAYGWPWDKLYRRSFINSAGLEYPPLPNSEDLVFVFQSLAMAKQISVIADILIHHRVNRKTSVSNSRHKDPDVPYRALALLQAALKKREIYSLYEQSFLNWAMEFLVWNAANIGEITVQRGYFDKLKHQWLPTLEFDMHPRNYYENRFTYSKYLLAKYAPWPVFFGVLTFYQKWKRSTRNGEH